LNVGEGVFGKGTNFMRQVLVFKKLTRNSFLAIPLTGSEKIGSWYVPIQLSSRKSFLMLDQARILDKRRLQRKIVILESATFQLIKGAFREFYC
jgi:mRNA-degrading endonuclease toxin of MazEF toxin-antitoxin module